MNPAPSPLPTRRETFIGDALHPEDASFATDSMSAGAPGLPRTFSWKRRQFSVAEVLEQWKEAGDCRHGSGERYIRKHWFRIRTTDGTEMKIYFERQPRHGSKPGAARWRLYTIATASENSAAATPAP